LQSAIQEIRQADADVLAICVDPVEENAKVAQKLNLDFPILSDPEFKAIGAYHVLHEDAGTSSGFEDIARPAVFILDRDGVVRWSRLTDNWRVRVRSKTILEQLSVIP
jgi:peroxiredoxin Q/BCP